MEIGDDECERSFIWFYRPLQNSLYEVYRSPLQMSRRTHRRTERPDYKISTSCMDCRDTHACRARAKFASSPFPHLEPVFSCIRHIGALTPCQTPAQPVSCQSRLTLQARSVKHHSMRCTHVFRWKPCRHTTDVIPENSMHDSPGLTLRAEHYAATLMAHMSAKQMIESISAMREGDRTLLSSLLIFDTEHPGPCQIPDHACGWLCRLLLF
jgi:hypothetical protein